MDWQTMETAPKNGAPLRGLVAGEDRRIAFTKVSHIGWYTWCLIDQGPEDCEPCSPTHWRPE